MKQFPYLLICLMLLVNTNPLITAGVIPITGASLQQASGMPGGLFTPVANHVLPESAKQPGVLRYQITEVNIEMLGGRNGPPLDGSGTGETLLLNLFPDTNFMAVLDHVEANPTGSYTWIGHLEGYPLSSVILVANAGVLVGKIATPDEIYQLEFLGDQSAGLHIVRQIDPAVFDDFGDDVLLPPAESNQTADQAKPYAADDGGVIDILAVYTPAASASAGGTTAIQSMIESAVADANLANANSGVNTRLFLVSMQEVDYTESGNSSTDLGRLRTHGDGYMDVVTQPASGLRDVYHADVVTMVPSSGESGICGLGYLQNPAPSAGFVNYAFTWVKLGCLVGNNTLAHEWGHNMGLNHDWYVNGSLTPYTYGHGYIQHTSAPRWRSVMSYGDLCTAAAVNCGRVAYWSNPSMTLNGITMGVPGGTKSDCVAGSLTPDPSSCDSDEHLVLNNVTPTAAQFRSSAITWLGSSTDWNDVSNWDKGFVPRFLDDVIIPSAPPGGKFPIISANYSIRNVTISSGAQLSLTLGTLTVYGNWEEQGSGKFDGDGSSVVFKSPLNQTIQASSASHFGNIQIGDSGSSQQVSLKSDIHVNGTLTIAGGATLLGGSYTLRVGGNWIENPAGFIAGSSTVIFDGGSQSIAKTTAGTVLFKDFSEYNGGTNGSFTSAAPVGWTVAQNIDGPSNAYYFGWSSSFGIAPPPNSFAFGHLGAANIKFDTSLYSPQLNLQPDTSYQLSYRYRVYRSDNPINYIATLNSKISPGDVVSTLVNIPGVSSTSWNTATQSFSVSNAGLYYLGIRNTTTLSATNIWGGMLDDIKITAARSPIFYNLIVAGSGTLVMSQNLKLKHDLTIQPGARFDLSQNQITVDGAVVNHGTLLQTKIVNNGSVPIVEIRDGAGTNVRYRGVELTSSSNLGLVTAAVRSLNAGENCPVLTGTPVYVRRCFDITPSASLPATVRLWALNSELNTLSQANLAVFHFESINWQETPLRSTGSSGADYVYAQGNVTSFSPFALAGTGAVFNSSLKMWLPLVSR
jgi:hypothetical protein